MDGMYAKRSSRWAVRVLPLLAACYTQRPLTVPVPTVGTQIVASVTDSGVVAMSNALGPGAVEVEGVIAAADASAWELQLVRVDYRGGTSTLWKREVVTFPRSTLATPIEKRRDKRKSWLAAGLITASALLAARVFTGALGGGGGSDTPPTPAN